MSASLSIQIGFDNGPLETVTIWTEIRDYVQGLEIVRGSTNELDAVSPGTIRLTLDNTVDSSGGRPFDPDDTASPFFGKLLPGRPIRVIATYLALPYPLFYGSVDSWGPIGYNPAVPYATVELTATDNLRLLYDLPLRPQRPWTLEDATLGAIDSSTILIQGPAEYPAEHESGIRIGKLLDLAGWPTGLRDIDGGQTVLKSDAPPDSERIGSYIERIRVTEYGRVWVKPDGTFAFDERRSWQSRPQQKTSQATFSDAPTGGELPYNECAYDPGSRTQLKNVVRRGQDGGQEFRVVDSPSIAAYGPREDARTDLLMRDSQEAQDQANYVLGRYKNPTSLVRSITLDSTHAEATMLPQQLGRELYDRITVVRRSRSGAALNSREYWIERIEHRFDRFVDRLITTWSLSQAETSAFWTLEDPTLGAVDSTNLIAY